MAAERAYPPTERGGAAGELSRLGSGERGFIGATTTWLTPRRPPTLRFREGVVVTLDGVGDGLSGTISTLAEGKLTLVSAIGAKDSFGILYEMVTRLLNMRELEDEGKVMALASYGYAPPDGRNRLMELFEVEGLKVPAVSPRRVSSRFLARKWR